MTRNLSLTTRLVLRVVAGLFPVVALIVAAMSLQHFRGEQLRDDLTMRGVSEAVLADFAVFQRAAVGLAPGGALESKASLALVRVAAGLERLLDPHHGPRPVDIDAARAAVENLVARIAVDRSAAGIARMAPDIDAAGALVGRVVAECAEHFARSVDGFVEQGEIARAVVGVTLIVVLMAVMWFAYQTVRRFVQPLQRAVALARRIGTDASLEDFEVDPRADTGHLLATMREMQGNLQRYRRDAETSQHELRNKVIELAASRASLEDAHGLAKIGTWSWEPASGRVQWSAQLYANLGFGPDVPAPSLRSFLRRVPRDERRALADELRILLHASAERSCEHHVLTTEDGSRVMLHRVRSMGEEQGAPARLYGTVQDVSERRRATDEIRRHAHYDALTRLPNRALLTQRLEVALTGSDKVAVLFVNIDRFRRINASLGHGIGDRVLNALAQRLADTTRMLVASSKGEARTGFVARFGGDEFVAVFGGVDNPQDVSGFSTRIVVALTTPLHVDDQQLVVAVHVGIAMGPDDAPDAQTLIDHASSACSLARLAGLNASRFFTADMNAETVERLRVEGDLRHAIEAGNQFFLAYQPKVDLGIGRPMGVEALIRWRHPVRGLMMPGAFIGLAEEFGLIDAISSWVMNEACAQVARWRAQGLAPIPVAINISGSSFSDPSFADQLSSVCAGHGVEPGLIMVEITETVLMAGAGATMRTLEGLHQAGFRLSVDDFGTGYSSLGYLHRFPIDELKIDRTFVSEITRGVGERAIVSAIVVLGHNLGMNVVAEGVETLEQARLLRELGCPRMQGFLFARPSGPEAIAEMLRSDRRFDVSPALTET